MCLRGDPFLKEFRLGTWLLTIERRTFGLGSSAICETGGTGRIHLRINLGSLSPMDGQTRTESFRLGRYWRDRCNNEETSVSTGVTCPTMRIHPAIIAQAAATAAVMMLADSSLASGPVKI